MPGGNYYSNMKLLVGFVIILNLHVSHGQIGIGRASKIEDGGTLYEDTIIRRFQSPILIKNSLRVSEEATLTIEPGVEVRFAPGVMLAVNGTLIAKGTATDRIKLTKDPGTGQGIPEWPEDIRLVDEWTVARGRLQMFYGGKWRGVCANFVNWTRVDTNITCQQLGFRGGEFRFMPWASNFSDYMNYFKPDCKGDEGSILNCPGYNNIKIGSRICENQQTIHLECEGLHEKTAPGWWWGLEFYNSSIKVVTIGNKKINESASVLEYVDIMYAGVDPLLQPVPAIRASPTAPHLINVSIMYSALDGTNFTNIKSSMNVSRSELSHNRGHGFVVESNIGHVVIEKSNIHNNKGNGVKMKFLDGKWPYFNVLDTFCWLANLPSQKYPMIMTGVPLQAGYSTICTRVFKVDGYQNILTLHVLELDIEQGGWGRLVVRDGETENDRIIAEIPIVNGSLPQSISSTYNVMRVNFEWKRPITCKILPECVKFTIMVDAGTHKTTPEFFMKESFVQNNTQHGLFIENVRNQILINDSSIIHNKYSAGIRVYGGAGDVIVNASRIDYNQDNGVNITYYGGYRIFNMSSFSHNYGNGINVTFNETTIDNKTRYAQIQKTEVFRSTFIRNDGMGVRVGNFCREHFAVVNDSRFEYNEGDAIFFDVCYKIIPMKNITNMTVGYNIFRGNYGHAVKITPMINAVGRIGNNSFYDHPRHVLLIDNTDDFLLNRYYSRLPVRYQITSNEFRNNRGFYVANLRLSQGSSNHTMDFKYNTMKGNVIEGGASNLNYRTRAYAVVIVSSSNINCSRNILVNVDSRYELATHMLDRSIFLSATRQWWGTINYEIIIQRIFDQHNRYNLANIEYHPVIKTEDDMYDPTGERVTFDQKPIEVAFNRGNILGGRLASTFQTVKSKTYHIDRDITILPEGTLIINEGVTFEFENSIGVLVHGEMKAIGTTNLPIKFDLMNVTTYTNESAARLVDGLTEYEGRLEVLPAGEESWGTVCNQGWNIRDAAVVCQMMGLVVHPDDWTVPNEKPGDPNQPIWRSQVSCTDLDIDVTKCQADGPFDHTCDHTMDVYVKCMEPMWAGIHYLATARGSPLVHVRITKAGLMDPTTITYTAAVKIDYNVHQLDNLHVTHCASSGIEIMHNDFYSNTAIRNSKVAYNQGNGISTRGPFLTVEFSDVHDNLRNGIEYNPHYTTFEAQQIRTGIHDSLVIDSNLAASGYDIADEQFRFITTPFLNSTHQTFQVELRVGWQYRVVVDILDYDPDTSEEVFMVYDAKKNSIRDDTFRWQVEEDLVDFPVVSTGTAATLSWQVKGSTSGRLTMVVRSKPWDREWPWPDFLVHNTSVVNNQRGIVTRHYNQPSNEYLDLFHRYRWQRIHLYGVNFQGNREEALHVPSITKYHPLYMPTFEELQNPHRMAEITYEIDSCEIKENGIGILGEHNHIEFSNNVWIWQVTHNVVEKNKRGGFSIELPKVNLGYQEVFNHSVDVNDTVFENNEKFEFRIDGFYCNSSVARNRFQNNKCLLGCISFTGTEKDIDVHDNEVYDNEGRYIMEFNMDSHTPYTRIVDATVMYNNFKRNRMLNTGSTSPCSSPTSYTVGVKGVQNITLNRNLFSNHLDYELVAGQASTELENYLDVTENYWGSAEQGVIRDKIFDFDDWNNFAIAEYFPFLTYDNFPSALSSGTKYYLDFNIGEPIGGRIEGPMTLYKDKSPYIVKSDITIMPTGSVYIESGVELKFYPNVGILVLGSLTARGYEDERIKFGPIKREDQCKEGRVKRQINVKDRTSVHGSIRLTSTEGHAPNEGFVEMYNATERRWSLICDNNFNYETALVACREMGYDTENVIVETNHYYDIFVLGYPLMHEQNIEWFWRNTFICDGRETHLEQCRYKINYDLYQCMERRDYVFIKCGDRNLASEYDYWGNIRFSTPEIEQGAIGPGYSLLEFVDIYGAGMLHEDRAAAVQAVYRTPFTNNVHIMNCAWNGYEFIAPKDEFIVEDNRIENINGYGIGGLVLNGESQEGPSTFKPLVANSMPYNVHGLVRMCTSEKLITVKDRVLLYFKYNFLTIDCVKIFRSREIGKKIGLRLLQFNLYNDTFYKNAIEMYNSEFFAPDLKIGEITPNSTESDLLRLYMTNEYFDTMGVRITASAAHGVYGFVAEIITVPQSPGWRPELGPGYRQRIIRTTMSKTQGGGFHFMNVGELNPSLIIDSCLIQNSGYKLLNITSPPIAYIYIQNSRLLTISNNFFGNSAGGLNITSETSALSKAIYANITNNMIFRNTHGSSLNIQGHHYQGFDVRWNYIAENNVDFRNIIGMFNIYLNFSRNVLISNVGRTTINATVPEKVSIAQNYFGNSIYDNLAIGGNHTTIFLGSAKSRFEDNYILNWRNIFEMVTFNRSKLPEYGDRYPPVEAERNWWGSPNEFFVAGRIWDRKDDDNLIEVNYKNFYKTNTSIPGVVQGRCKPGWKLYDRLNKCYLYLGGAMPYLEAKKQCGRIHGRLASLKERATEVFVGEIVIAQQFNYDEFWKVWVFKDYSYASKCMSLVNYRVVEQKNCQQLLPAVCERDPYAMPVTYWRPIAVSLGVVGGVLFIVFIIIGFACLKSRQRTEKRLERRNSLRASLRASKQTILSRNAMDNTMSSQSVAAMGHTPVPAVSIGGSMKKRRRPHLSGGNKGNNHFLDISGITLGESNTDSFDKLNLESRRPSTPHSYLDRSYSNPKLLQDSSSYLDSDLHDTFPNNRLENEITHINARPMMDSLARGGAYADERSLDRSFQNPPQNRSYNKPRRPPLKEKTLDYSYSTPKKQPLYQDEDELSLASSYAGSRYNYNNPTNYNNSGYNYDDPLGEPSRPQGRGTKPPRPVLPQDRLDRSTSSEFDSRPPRARPKESDM